MAWYYEILGQDDEVVEASEALYATAFSAQMAGYQRLKEKPSLFGPLPTTGWKDEGGLRTHLSSGPKINAQAETRLIRR